MHILNKKAKFEYKLDPERFEAGVSLRGAEAKSLRNGRGSISDSTARVMNGEVFLINANIPADGLVNYNPTRIRKLLLHKNEIVTLETKAKQQKLTLVPTKMYTKGRLIKLELALGRSKHKFEKRETIKKRDVERELEKEYKSINT